MDRLTLRLVNERILTAEDFGKRAVGPMEGSVVLTPCAWTRFLGEYEHAMTEARPAAPGGMRERMHGDLEKLAGRLRSGEGFEAFREEG